MQNPTHVHKRDDLQQLLQNVVQRDGFSWQRLQNLAIYMIAQQEDAIIGQAANFVDRRDHGMRYRGDNRGLSRALTRWQNPQYEMLIFLVNDMQSPTLPAAVFLDQFEWPRNVRK